MRLPTSWAPTVAAAAAGTDSGETMPVVEISVVAPSRNRPDLLAACLRALTAQTHPSFEIVVVDDASSDDPTDTVRRHAPAARLIELGENRGFAAAANEGARAATGRYIAFLNTDA